MKKSDIADVTVDLPTKRELFAAAALIGLIARDEHGCSTEPKIRFLVSAAFMCADEMIEQSNEWYEP